MLSYEQARQKVIEVISVRHRLPAREVVDLHQALRRVLAEPVVADRDYPPFERATRDGFAVRASDVGAPGATLEIVGEIKAGDTFTGTVLPGQCAQIMTGAAVPAGANAVVMIEHTRPSGGQVVIDRAAESGQNIVPRGSEAEAGQELLAPGMRLGYAELALAAQVGQQRLSVFARPRVAVLSTGDEVVPMDAQPGPFQIRNSNSVSLVAQAALAGGEPVPLGNAPDSLEELRSRIESGLEADILVLSGGVSMGDYDFTKAVFRDLGAEMNFWKLAIRPGQPLAFGKIQGKLAFGLPGNPVSSMVTFEQLVRPAMLKMTGHPSYGRPVVQAVIQEKFSKRTDRRHFLRGVLTREDSTFKVRTTGDQGSGILTSMVKANCLIDVPVEVEQLNPGDTVSVQLLSDAAWATHAEHIHTGPHRLSCC